MSWWSGLTRLAVAFALVAAHGLADAHGHLLKAVVNGQTACASNAPGNACAGTANLRKLIPRSGNDGACAIPPGCELGCPGVTGALPGAGAACESQGTCDHCALEKTAGEKAQIGPDGSKWWTKKPAGHWDEPDQWPKFACMSRDAFGARGTVGVAPGATVTTTMYMNADHSGLYRFELACGGGDVASAAGNAAMNAAFNAAPITPWKALHVSKELGGGAPLAASREVGSTRAETDAYMQRMVCTAAGCPYRMNGANPQYPQGAYDIGSAACEAGPAGTPGVTCYVEDTFAIPADTACSGDAVLRWMWNSAEGEETYANCLDLSITGTGVGGTPGAGGAVGGSPGGGVAPGTGTALGTDGGAGVSIGTVAGGLFLVALCLSLAYYYLRVHGAPPPGTVPAQHAPFQHGGAKPAPPAHRKSVLASGWAEHKDASGKYYYYNAQTKETSWTRPSVQPV